MAVGYNARTDGEGTVPKPTSPSSTIHDSLNSQPEPLPGSTVPGDAPGQPQPQLSADELQLVIATLQASGLMRLIIANLFAHVLYVSITDCDHDEPCPNCVLLVLLTPYYI